MRATVCLRGRAPQVLCRTNIFCVPAKDGHEAAKKLREIKAANENMFVIMNPSGNYMYVETRNKVGARSRSASAMRLHRLTSSR